MVGSDEPALGSHVTDIVGRDDSDVEGVIVDFDEGVEVG